MSSRKPDVEPADAADETCLAAFPLNLMTPMKLLSLNTSPALRLDTAQGIPVVVDPVMIAKGGEPLLSDKALGAVLNLLVPRAALLTPNAPEAAALTGRNMII